MPPRIVTPQDIVSAVRRLARGRKCPIVPTTEVTKDLDAHGNQWSVVGRSGGHLEKADRRAIPDGLLRKWRFPNGHSGWSLPDSGVSACSGAAERVLVGTKWQDKEER